MSKNFVDGEDLQYMLPGPFSHGAHVAGTIAAAENDFGTIGVAPDAELVLVKVLSDTGSGTFGDVISGISYAADVGAHVINMSLGAYLPRSGTFFDEDGNLIRLDTAAIQQLLVALDRATSYAYQKGSTVIASAGNAAVDGDKDAAWVHVPSASVNVVSISATGPLGWALDFTADLDEPAFYTNFGLSAIDFAAPGGNVDFDLSESGVTCTVAGLLRPCWVFDLVFSTGNGSWYWSAGTSMAAPHAAGVAALIISANGGEMTPAQVRAALHALADDLGSPGKDPFYGHGRVSAAGLAD